MNSQNLLIQKTSCDYLYGEPKYETTNKYLYDRWLAALILACLVLLCDLGLAFFGFMHCSNFGFSSNIQKNERNRINKKLSKYILTKYIKFNNIILEI